MPKPCSMVCKIFHIQCLLNSYENERKPYVLWRRATNEDGSENTRPRLQWLMLYSVHKQISKRNAATWDVLTRKISQNGKRKVYYLPNGKPKRKQNYCTKKWTKLNCSICVIAIYICLFLYWCCCLVFSFFSIILQQCVFVSQFVSLTDSIQFSAFKYCLFIYIYICMNWSELMFDAYARMYLYSYIQCKIIYSYR